MFATGYCSNCLHQYVFDAKTGAKLTSDGRSFHRCGQIEQESDISKSLCMLAEIVYNLTVKLGSVKEK
jgi:hypothetical protein